MSDTNPPVDDVVIEEKAKAKPIEDNVKSKSTWLRLVFMVGFGLLAWVAGMVGTLVIVFGFLWVLFTGEVNRQLAQVGQAIASYVYEIVRYMTFNTDDKPFPFGGDWPSGVTDED